jgi:hypothetical protein
VGVAQVFQSLVYVVEHNAYLVDLQSSFGKHYQNHYFFCLVSEVTPLQPDGLDKSRHLSNVYDLEHRHFPSFHVHHVSNGTIFGRLGSLCFANNFECPTCGNSSISTIVSLLSNTKTFVLPTLSRPY